MVIESALCAFCDHRNPEGAHFCNECGARLELTLCWLCDAVNDRGALVCHKCGAPLTEPPPEPAPVAIVADDVPVAVAAEVATPPKRRRLLPGVALATVCFVALAAGAMYFATRPDPPASQPALHETAAASPAPEAATPAPQAAAPEASPPNDAGTPVVSAEETPAEDKPLSEPAVVQADDAPSEEATTVTQAVPPPSAEKRVEKATRSRPAQRGPNRVAGAPRPVLTMPPRNTATNPQPSRRCTDAVAALGLCNLESSQ